MIYIAVIDCSNTKWAVYLYKRKYMSGSMIIFNGSLVG